MSAASFLRPEPKRVAVLQRFVESASIERENNLRDVLPHCIFALRKANSPFVSLVTCLSRFAQSKAWTVAAPRRTGSKHPREATDGSMERNSSTSSVEDEPVEATTIDTSRVTAFLKKMARCALQFDSLFPVSEELTVDASFVAWSKGQCLCILTCSFFTLFPRTSVNCECEEVEGLPSINFEEMYFSRAESVETEKMRMILEYFYTMVITRGYPDVTANPPVVVQPDEVHEQQQQATQGSIYILRHQASATDVRQRLERLWDQPLIPFVVHRERESIDDESQMLRVDFANALIGGASLAYGCVQEEITFSLCPELNTARLIHTPMGDNEAIVICGAEQFALLKPGTYGGGMKFLSATTQRRGGAVLAIDAMDYRSVPRSAQFTMNLIERELVKCYAAFSAPVERCGVPAAEAKCVATGNWGCGVFRGDLELKFLVQWLACSLADKTMHYFPFDQLHVVNSLNASAPLGNLLLNGKVTFGKIFSFLEQLGELLRATPQRASVWQLLMTFLTAE